MKKTLILGLIAFAAFGGATRLRYDVVILQSRQAQFHIDLGEPGQPNGYFYDGLDVYNVCSSSNAPQYRTGTQWYPYPPAGETNAPRINLAQTISELLDQDFVMKNSDPSCGTMLFIRRR